MSVESYEPPQEARATLESAVGALRALSVALRDDDQLDVTDFEDLARGLHAIQEVKRTVAQLEERVMNLVVEQMPSKVVHIDGLPPLERKTGTVRKAWDHEYVGKMLAAAAQDERIDRMTGEVLMTEGEAVKRLILDAAGISYWRTTVLKGKGIDPSECCEESKGKTQAVFG